MIVTVQSDRQRTKEALFADVLWRESEAYFEAWYDLVDHDPEGGTLPGVYRNALRAVRQNPLILALYTQQRFVLGSFVHDESYAKTVSGLVLWNVHWLEQLQAHGLIRDDIDAAIIAWIEVIFRQGLLTLPVDMQAQATINYEVLVDQFFTMLAQYLDTGAGMPSDVGKAVLRNYIDGFKAHYASPVG